MSGERFNALRSVSWPLPAGAFGLCGRRPHEERRHHGVVRRSRGDERRARAAQGRRPV